MNSLSSDRVGLVRGLAISAAVIYALCFIWRTSFVEGGERYFCLFDDAMISMTYARNLAAGEGLRWHPGAEAVEGITNPAWTAWMAVTHLLRLPAGTASLPVQLSGIVIIVLILLQVEILARRLSGPGSPVIGYSLMFTALSAPLHYWTLMGMETGAVTLVVLCAANSMFRSLDEDRFPSAACAWLLFGTLLRPDIAVFYAAFHMLVFLLRPSRRHFARGVVAAGILAAFLGLQAAARMAYYGDPLPNTYYLKLGGSSPLWRAGRGLQVTFAFIMNSNPLCVAVPLIHAAANRRRDVRFLGGIFLAILFYNIWVGGDAWEDVGGSNRFLTPVMPFLFVLLSRSVVSLVPVGLARIRPGAAGRPPVSQRVTAACAVLCLLSFNALYGYSPFATWLLLEDPAFVSANRKNVQQARIIADIAFPDAVVAVSWAGVVPYFTGLEAHDLLGKSDRRIARGHVGEGGDDPRPRPRRFLPGHMKADPAYSIGVVQPDIIVRIPNFARSRAEPWIGRVGYDRETLGGHDFLLKRGSPRLDARRIESLRTGASHP